MLAQLDKVKGVEKSYANRSGKLFRATVSHPENLEKVAKDIKIVLGTRTRSPTRLTGGELSLAVQAEEWRDAERITELTAIEHRTLTIRSVTEFAEKEHLDQERTDLLVKSAEQEWDRLAKEISIELRKDRDKRDWKPIYNRFEATMRKRARTFLSDDQLTRLIDAVESKL